jgi:c-di-GMP-binding flagellar brake protein YcgR
MIPAGGKAEAQMEEKGNSANSAAGQNERREDPRLEVDEEAALVLLNSGSRLDCRIVEISLTGCRMSLRHLFVGGVPARVETAFKLRGFSFRFSGQIEWSDCKHLAGVRFAEMASRRRDELVEVLCEIAAANATKAVKQAAERLAAEEAAQKMRTQPPATMSQAIQPADSSDGLRGLGSRGLAASQGSASPKPALEKAIAAPAVSAPAAPLAVAKAPASMPTKPSGRERRTQSRHEVNTSATILLVNVASRIPGRILNLSLGGCSIRTEERFPVGIYTRVETEFHHEGLPFRLGGVVQAIKERQHVGIRFLDMSQRKREQVEQLIAEIEELRQCENAGAASGPDGKALPA